MIMFFIMIDVLGLLSQLSQSNDHLDKRQKLPVLKKCCKRSVKWCNTFQNMLFSVDVESKYFFLKHFFPHHVSSICFSFNTPMTLKDLSGGNLICQINLILLF